MYVCMYVCMYVLNSPIRGEKAKTNGGDHDVDDPFREREREMRACTLGTLCLKSHMEELFWLDSKGARPPHLCTLSLS